MRSPFATLFLKLQDYLHINIPSIKYIDQDLGQLRSGTRPPVSWPCLLIDFEDFSFDNLAQNVQTASGTVVLRLGFAPFSNSAQATPAPIIRQAISYYDLEWYLHRYLQGWSPGDTYGSLSRLSATTLTRTEKYRIRELRYSLSFQDFSTKITTHNVPATISIEDQLST